MRTRDRSLSLLYMALAVLPVIAMITGIQGRGVYGVWEMPPKPALTASALISERFRQDLVTWFEGTLGLKGNAIALDNAILYHVFDETKPGAFIRIGKDGVLYPHEDINYYNKYGDASWELPFIEQAADRIAELQRRLKASKRALVPILIPSKTTMYPDELPKRWVYDLPEPRNSKRTVQRMREALDRRGVRYLDAIQLFLTSDLPRRDLFGPDARHWSSLGACLVNERVVALYAELTGAPPLPYDCPYTRARRGQRLEDWDLWRLTNAYRVPRQVTEMPLVRHSPAPPGLAKPRVLFVGSSFFWTVLFDAEDSGVFSMLHYNYYNQTFVTEANGRTPVEPGTPLWRDITMTNDLYVLDLFESYLPNGDHFQKFLVDMLAELDRAPLPVPSTVP